MIFDITQTEKVGSRIKELILANGDKVCNLAIEMGISNSQLKRLLADNSRWTEDKVLWFANKYGVPFESLYYGISIDELSELNTTEVTSILAYAMEQSHQLSQSEQKTLVKYLMKKMIELIELW
ncbi:MAG: hypothetical protein Q4E99_06850 [Bacillota bacterium]|nr:hypothetical protein [Bacillota bacterium]